jgi:hypothetical protein
MSTGEVLAVHGVDPRGVELLGVAAAAVAELFRGVIATIIEAELRQARRSPGRGGHYIQELVTFGPGLLHVLLRSRKHPTHALVFACRPAEDVDGLLATCRAALRSIDGTHEATCVPPGD